MIVQAPDNQVYGSALVSGWSQNGSETLRIAVILKAAYNLVGPSGSIRQMQPVDLPVRVGIVYEDLGQYRYEDLGGVTHVLETNELMIVGKDENGDPVPDRFSSDKIGKKYFSVNGLDVFVEDIIAQPSENLLFDVQREADIALEKARTDIVVEGYRFGTTDGAVVVDGAPWMIRAATTPLGLDTSRNLFGYQPRLDDDRAIPVAADFVPAAGDKLPPEYSGIFNNFYWRSDDFTTPLNRNLSPLPSTGQVDIFKAADLSGDAYSFTLPDLDLTARYRFHDGTLPDHAHCWRTTELGAMRPDTLIVEPDTNRATILWRVNWDAAAQPFEAYRRVEITQGVA
jgi:hypothetical protein